jgi:hypothetical protein
MESEKNTKTPKFKPNQDKIFESKSIDITSKDKKETISQILTDCVYKFNLKSNDDRIKTLNLPPLDESTLKFWIMTIINESGEKKILRGLTFSNTKKGEPLIKMTFNFDYDTVEWFSSHSIAPSFNGDHKQFRIQGDESRKILMAILDSVNPQKHEIIAKVLESALNKFK